MPERRPRIVATIAELLRALPGRRRDRLERFRRENPDAGFGEYYEQRVLEMLDRGDAHPSIGGNLRGGPFEEAGRDVFEFLRAEGLEPTDVCVDYGCGSLRVGQHLIRHLEPGRYWGLDISERFLEIGRELIGSDTMRRCRPRLLRITPAALERVAREEPAFLVSNGVLPHVPPEELSEFLSNVATVVGRATRAYLGVRLAAHVERVGDRSWAYPESRLREELDRIGIDARFVPRIKRGGVRRGAWIVATRRALA